jgi:membrane protein implicated in regulation of membrane protease activity
LNHVYLGAVAFGLTLLVASLVMGGKDTGDGAGDAGGGDGDHGDGGHGDGGHAHGDIGLGWVPITSFRFWVFLFTFGGGAGAALTWLGSSTVVAAVGALGVGWLSGTAAVAIVRSLTRHSVSSELGAAELLGETATVILPIGPGKPGKVRVDVKGRTEDFVANVVEDGGELPAGTAVLIVAEGESGSLLVAKADM